MMTLFSSHANAIEVPHVLVPLERTALLRAYLSATPSHQDVVAIGEVLVDWVCLDKTLDLSEATQFMKAPGGAPANVAVGLARLGVPVKFLGGRTDGLWGQWLASILAQEGVDLTLSPTLPHTNTRQVYVLTAPDGQRIFKGFTQHACADIALMPYHFDPLLEAHDLYPKTPNHQRIVYWGSVIQSHPPLAEALCQAVQTIRHQRENHNHQTLLCYDPNYRAPLWQRREEALARMRESFAVCDVLKISDDELPMFYPDMPLEQAGQALLTDYPNILWLIITCGKEGAWSVHRNHCVKIPAFEVQAVELTGAGDGFVAGLLRGLLCYMRPYQAYEGLQGTPLQKGLMQHILDTMPEASASTILRCAAGVGALATLKPGAMASLPSLSHLQAFMEKG
jgi:fructokinase